MRFSVKCLDIKGDSFNKNYHCFEILNATVNTSIKIPKRRENFPISFVIKKEELEIIKNAKNISKKKITELVKFSFSMPLFAIFY